MLNPSLIHKHRAVTNIAFVTFYHLDDLFGDFFASSVANDTRGCFCGRVVSRNAAAKDEIYSSEAGGGGVGGGV